MWSTGCPLGKYGDNCDNSGYCKGPYDLVTGNCTSGCLDGWVGYSCGIGKYMLIIVNSYIVIIISRFTTSCFFSTRLYGFCMDYILVRYSI